MRGIIWQKLDAAIVISNMGNSSSFIMSPLINTLQQKLRLKWHQQEHDGEGYCR